jgi:hypothetical protein
MPVSPPVPKPSNSTATVWRRYSRSSERRGDPDVDHAQAFVKTVADPR